MVLGPYGVIVCLLYAVIHLYRENTELRKASMDALRKYQERDEEDRKARLAREEDERRWQRERGHIQPETSR